MVCCILINVSGCRRGWKTEYLSKVMLQGIKKKKKAEKRLPVLYHLIQAKLLPIKL